MNHHRFLREVEPIRLPHPPAAITAPTAFVLCPVLVPVQLWPAQQSIYQIAFEQAQAVVRPSLPERDLLAVWN